MTRRIDEKGEWRIVERWCVRDWMRVEVGSGELRVADDSNGWPQPRRDRTDVVYAPLR